MSEDTPRAATNLRPDRRDDYLKTFERRRALDPTTHAQMLSLDDFTIRVAPGSSKRVLPSHNGGPPVSNCSSSPSAVDPAGQTVVWIGLDWADQQHAVCLQPVGSSQIESTVVGQTPEALHAWVSELRRRFPVGRVAIALEQSRGSVFYALMNYDFLLLYPVAPASVAAYRKALYPSGGKDDPVDAGLILELLLKHRDHLRAWKPDEAPIRQLRLMAEHRRKLVDDRTALINQISNALKIYFPQALEYLHDLSVPWTWSFLERWPTLAALQKARRSSLRTFFRQHARRSAEEVEQLWNQIRTTLPLTSDAAVIESYQLLVQSLACQLKPLAAAVKQYDQGIERLFEAHSDHLIFDSLPGAGAALAPRLLAAWGSDRERFNGAGEMQQFSGVAPLIEKSGKMRWVHWRLGCPKFLRQSFQEFAAQSRLQCAWANAYYQQMRARGCAHHTAVRALAFKWIRIMYRCWKDRTPYDESRYLASLKRRGSPLQTVVSAAPPAGVQP